VRQQVLETCSDDASNFGHAMKESIVLLAILLLGWYVYSEYQLRAHPSSANTGEAAGLPDSS
jgi:hypothetical protein